MKIKLINDNNKRVKYKKAELKRLLLKSIVYNQHVDSVVRLKAQFSLSKLTSNNSATRIHNRCTETGRSRAIYRDFKVSRIYFRLKALDGQFAGITKSSW